MRIDTETLWIFLMHCFLKERQVLLLLLHKNSKLPKNIAKDCFGEKSKKTKYIYIFFSIEKIRDKVQVPLIDDAHIIDPFE